MELQIFIHVPRACRLIVDYNILLFSTCSANINDKSLWINLHNFEEIQLQ